MHNSLRPNNLDGEDAKSLIHIFRWRKESKHDFSFNFDVDSNSSLCCFFWRDGGMRSNYDVFGDFLMHDTTYHMNKYDMICGPFVGMDNHCRNIMFSCGFLKNEKIYSFVWLFNTFLKPMGGKYPVTVMTDQSDAMNAAIGVVFLKMRHQLCI